MSRIPLIPIVCVLMFTGCGGPAVDKGKGPPPVPVVTAQAAKRDVPLRLRAVGQAEASELVTVRPQVTAMLIATKFTEGDVVAAGQPLFQLDDRQFTAAVRQAEAALGRDRAQAAFATADAKRIDDLVLQKLASEQQAEQVRATRDAALATAAASEALLERARLDLSFCTITAPIAGRTGSFGMTPGNLVSAGQTQLVTIARMQPMRVTVAVPASRLAAVTAAQARSPLVATVVPDGYERLESGTSGEPGSLDLIDNQIDPATGTIRLRIVCPNAAGRLWPGQQCQVDLTLGIDTGVVTVPETAVLTGQRGSLVWVVAGGTAEAHPVEIARTGDGFAVISKGIEGGETVVTDGQLRLTKGAKVDVSDPGKAPATDSK